MHKKTGESQWTKLLSLALPILNDLPENMAWALGGGTAISIQIHHRISFDIDIFFEYTKAIREIAKNPKTKKIAKAIQYPGNYLKIEREEGEIDFISAGNITDDPHKHFVFRNQNILIEDIDEIIAKKIKFRSNTFTIRDVFDLAAAVENDTNILHRICKDEDMICEIKKVDKRISALTDIKINNTNIVTKNNYILKNMFDICKTSIQYLLIDTDISPK